MFATRLSTWKCLCAWALVAAFAETAAYGQWFEEFLGGPPPLRLPTFDDYELIIEGPNGECYWPVEMGTCEQPDPPGGFYEYWTNESAITFAPWVGTSGFWPPDALLYVRCVMTE